MTTQGQLRRMLARWLHQVLRVLESGAGEVEARAARLRERFPDAPEVWIAAVAARGALGDGPLRGGRLQAGGRGPALLRTPSDPLNLDMAPPTPVSADCNKPRASRRASHLVFDPPTAVPPPTPRGTRGAHVDFAGNGMADSGSPLRAGAAPAPVETPSGKVVVTARLAPPLALFRRATPEARLAVANSDGCAAVVAGPSRGGRSATLQPVFHGAERRDEAGHSSMRNPVRSVPRREEADALRPATPDARTGPETALWPPLSPRSGDAIAYAPTSVQSAPAFAGAPPTAPVAPGWHESQFRTSDIHFAKPTPWPAPLATGAACPNTFPAPRPEAPPCWPDLPAPMTRAATPPGERRANLLPDQERRGWSA